MIDFRILGPLEVRDGDRRLVLKGARQRTLLAALLLRANEVVSTDQLIEHVWDGAPPEGASKALQVAVSRLRRTLDCERGAAQRRTLLVTRPSGYELCVERDQLDVCRFEDLLHDGREALAAADPQTASDTLTRALALWRGPPLAELAGQPFSQPEIRNLEELHVTALETRIAADLELGRHATVIAELDELARLHPLRERLREMQMLALYRAGRQADALAVYRDARRTLTEQLGIEPGRDLRDLQEAILRQDNMLDLRPRPGAARPAGARAFVGRDRELEELLRALTDARAGQGRLVLLVGEPGIGKSRLAEELLTRARAAGTRVIVGRCWEAGGAPAYWPWVQSLRAYVRQTERGRLRVELGTAVADLAPLLPELQDLLDGEQPRALDAEGARFRLFEAVGQFLRAAARDRPLVVMLDDLHAADEPSLLLLRFLAREMADSRLLVVCALRDIDPVPREPLNALLAELAREPHARQIALTGLSAADVALLVERASGIDPPPRVVEAIHAETEGNSLFVAEFVQLLDSEGTLGDPDVHLRVPPGVRAVIGQRLRRLSEPCRSVLLEASVLGREFDVDVLAQLGRIEQGAVLDVLDEAIAERVVGDVPGSPGRMRFGHALIRDALYDELSAARSALLHRAAGEAIEVAHANRLEQHLAELAHHFFAATATAATTADADADADKAIDYARRCASRAMGQSAFEEAVRLYRMALTLVEDGPARCELLLSLGEAQARAGDSAAARLTYLAAADIAASRGMRDDLAHAALGYGGRLIWEVSRGDSEHVPLLERALEAVGNDDSAMRVRLLTRLAGGPLRDASFPARRRHALSRDALDMARRIGDQDTLAYALSGHIAANHSPPFTPSQVGLAGELIEVAMRTGDLERASEGHEHRLAALVELGRVDEAHADLVEMARLAATLRQPSHDWFVAVYGALLALLHGDLAEAEEGIARGRVIGERAQSWNAAVTYGLQLYLLRRDQGRLNEIEDLVRRAALEHVTYPVWRCVLAQMHAALGQRTEAMAVLDGLAVAAFAALPVDEEWLVAIGFLAETVHILDADEQAATLYELLLPFGDRIAISPPEISTGAVARHLGLLATTLARWPDAEGHFASALEIHERIAAPIWWAHTARAYAGMLLARASPQDERRAQRLLADAGATYRARGAVVAPDPQ